ncbi:hypothetical protein CROQUDRAFT_98841 [Cronartium quercuum f. sp. fusiforme G11]|uniref:Uncharacterized protein n=1 Tax=Cronartium quercuum f. sp. fusiforme G11 TaxID=708437 RepID=A0A9P6T7D4_9BASI|nr:hypothetical protein CROQUDRAFT_98841 [Cronartium quercuum f. sp. fusiforme G11]
MRWQRRPDQTSTNDGGNWGEASESIPHTDLRRSCEPHSQSRRSFWTPEAPKGLFLRSVGASPPLELHVTFRGALAGVTAPRNR